MTTIYFIKRLHTIDTQRKVIDMGPQGIPGPLAEFLGGVLIIGILIVMIINWLRGGYIDKEGNMITPEQKKEFEEKDKERTTKLKELGLWEEPTSKKPLTESEQSAPTYPKKE